MVDSFWPCLPPPPADEGPSRADGDRGPRPPAGPLVGGFDDATTFLMQGKAAEGPIHKSCTDLYAGTGRWDPGNPCAAY